MNVSTFERAMLVNFAHRAARYTGSLDCMRAVCYVIRNRVKAGWGTGTWLSVMEAHNSVEGNFYGMNQVIPLNPQDRLLQMLVREVDDIYLGTSSDLTAGVVQDALYYQAVDLPPRNWFVDHIVRDAENHARIAQVGPLAFFR